MKIRSRLAVLAMLAVTTCAFFPSTAFADGDRKSEIGTRNLAKELHRLEETMEELEATIERAQDAGQRDTAKQLRATLDALRFVKKQIIGRMEKAEKKRAKAPKRERAERIRIDIEELKRRREELRERLAGTDRANGKERIKRQAEKLLRQAEQLREIEEQEHNIERLRGQAHQFGKELEKHAKMLGVDAAGLAHDTKKDRNFIKRLRVDAPKTVVAKDEHVIIIETDKDGQVERRVIRGGDGGRRGFVRLGDDLEIDVEELIKRRRPADRELRKKLDAWVERARDTRRGRGNDPRGHRGDLANRVERLQNHVKELTQGLHHLRRQVEELQNANKKLHVHLKHASQPRPVKAPTPPRPPQAPSVRMRLGGAGGMGGGPSDARLARIEELLKKLLELQIQQAKAR